MSWVKLKLNSGDTFPQSSFFWLWIWGSSSWCLDLPLQVPFQVGFDFPNLIFACSGTVSTCFLGYLFLLPPSVCFLFLVVSDLLGSPALPSFAWLSACQDELSWGCSKLSLNNNMCNMHIQATLPSRVQMFLVTGTSIISAVNLGKMLLCHCLVSPRNFYPWELCQAVFPVPEMEMNVIFWKITACGYVLFHRKLLPYQGFFLQCIF